MARRTRSLSCLVLAGILLGSLVAAGPAWAQSGAQPKRGGVIRIAEREAPGLDPHLSISFLSHSYVSLAYSQLVRFPNGPEQKSPDRFLDPPRPGREVDRLQGRQGLHVQPS